MAPRSISPGQAVTLHLAPIHAAVRCIAHGTLVTTTERGYAVGPTYVLVLNSGKPLRLRSTPPIYLDLGQHFRILRDQFLHEAAHRVEVIKYFYAFSTSNDQELLNFQWTPEEGNLGRKTFPHLHVGRALLERASIPVLRDFHKKHIPTGYVSIGSIVRFAIEELGVPPLRPDWSDVLDRGQAQFERSHSR